MTIHSASGTRIYIGEPLLMGSAALTAADFASQIWVEISEVEAFGRLGGEVEISTYEQMSPDRPDDPAHTRKIATSVNSGSMQLICGADFANEGQIAIVGATANRYPYAFKIALSGDASTEDRFFSALVKSSSEVIDTASSIIKIEIVLEIDSNIVRVS